MSSLVCFEPPNRGGGSILYCPSVIEVVFSILIDLFGGLSIGWGLVMKINMWAVKANLKTIGIIILCLVGFYLGLNALGINLGDDDGDSDYCESHPWLHCG